MSPIHNVGIFWDYENCAPSSNGSGFQLIENIRQLSQKFGSVNLFKAYLQFPEKTSPKLCSLRSELQACGVSLTDCPHNGKNTVDFMMIVDIMSFVKDNPAPATVILISGDRDFAYMLSTIRWRQYRVVLISNTIMTHDSLSSQANVAFDWQGDVLKTRNDGDATRPTFYKHRREVSAPITSYATKLGIGSLECAEQTPGSEATSRSLAGLSSDPRRSSFSIPSTTTLNTASETPQPGLLADVPLILTTPTARLDVTKSIVCEEDSSISDVPALHSHPDGTNPPPSPDEKPSTVGAASVEDILQSPVFKTPELTPGQFGGDMSSEPVYLLLLNEDGTGSIPLADPSTKAGQPASCTKAGSGSRGQAWGRTYPLFDPADESYCPPVAESSPAKRASMLPVAPSSNSVEPDTMASNVDVAQTHAPAELSVPGQGTSAIKLDFTDLIVILDDMRLKGIQKNRFSAVAPLLLERKPNIYQSAGVFQLKAYLQLAEKAGLVTIEQGYDGVPWMCLPSTGVTEPRPFSPVRSCPPPVSSDQIPTKLLPSVTFHDLILVLNELRINGDAEPRFYTVGQMLRKRNTHVYESAGTKKFKDYIDAAVNAGVVTVRDVVRQNGDGRITLCDEWCATLDQSQSPSPKQQPTSLATNTLAFQPLIDALEGLRAKDQWQPSIWSIWSHLGWASERSKIYELAGVTDFTEYISAAVASGIIIVIPEAMDASDPGASVCLRSVVGDLKVTVPSASDMTATGHIFPQDSPPDV